MAHLFVQGLLGGGGKNFADWLVNHGWESVQGACTSHENIYIYQSQLLQVIDRFFPLKKHLLQIDRSALDKWRHQEKDP